MHGSGREAFAGVGRASLGVRGRHGRNNGTGWRGVPRRSPAGSRTGARRGPSGARQGDPAALRSGQAPASGPPPSARYCATYSAGWIA